MFHILSSNRILILALGTALALLFTLQRSAGGKAPPAANLPGEARMVEAAAPATPKPIDKAAIKRRSDKLVGDRDLRGELDLGKMKRTGEHFMVPIGGGAEARLTLDPKVQEAAEKVLERARAPRAAIVVMTTDGKILALAGLDGEREKPKRDFDLPLSVWAPAASIFKIVTAAALVQRGVSPTKKVCYHGGLRGVEKSQLVDSRRDDACHDLGYALAKSQNALIAKLAHKYLDRKTLRNAAHNFGFAEAPDFALEAQKNTVELPSDELEFARFAAGFWNSELSTLGGALVANVIASGGMKVTPRIVEEIVDGERRIPVVAHKPERVVDGQIAKKVAEMMKGTVKYGTAFKGFHDGRGREFLSGTVAGKTGSLTRDNPYLDYSWFVGFAPADNPQVVISVLLGNPPKWHLKAHTAARLVLDSLY